MITSSKFHRNPFSILAKRWKYRWRGTELGTDTSRDGQGKSIMPASEYRQWRHKIKLSRSVFAITIKQKNYAWFVFVARCYASEAYVVMRCLCLSVCVCPSRSCILSKRINISSNFFSPSGSHTTLVFPHQTSGQYSDGTPSPNGGMKCTGGIKNHDFRLISRFISELVQDRAIVTMEGE